MFSQIDLDKVAPTAVPDGPALPDALDDDLAGRLRDHDEERVHQVRSRVGSRHFGCW